MRIGLGELNMCNWFTLFLKNEAKNRVWRPGVWCNGLDNTWATSFYIGVSEPEFWFFSGFQLPKAHSGMRQRMTHSGGFQPPIWDPTQVLNSKFLALACSIPAFVGIYGMRLQVNRSLTHSLLFLSPTLTLSHSVCVCMLMYVLLPLK